METRRTVADHMADQLLRCSHQITRRLRIQRTRLVRLPRPHCLTIEYGHRKCCRNHMLTPDTGQGRETSIRGLSTKRCSLSCRRNQSIGPECLTRGYEFTIAFHAARLTSVLFASHFRRRPYSAFSVGRMNRNFCLHRRKDRCTGVV